MPRGTTNRSPGRRWFRWTVLALAGAVWYVALAPTGLGGPLGVIWVSGTSMEPTMHTGDLAIMYRSDRYEVGDIVAFEIPGGGTVIHRVAEAGDGQYRFQGDNRDYTDPWRLGDDDIIGREIVTIPRVGTVAAILGRPTSLAVLVAMLAFLWWSRRHIGRPAPEPERDRSVTRPAGIGAASVSWPPPWGPPRVPAVRRPDAVAELVAHCASWPPPSTAAGHLTDASD